MLFDPPAGRGLNPPRMLRSTWACKLLVGVCLLMTTNAAGEARTASDAGQILADVDTAATQAKDLVGTLKLTIIDKSGARAKRTLAIWQKGGDRRMAKFQAPATVRGVGLLAKGDEGTFLYLPEFGRVRRIVGRSRGDSFFGTDFTNDDMALVKYADRFVAKLLGEDKDRWKLRLEPKNQRDEPWHHVNIEVRRADHVIAQAEFHEAEAGDPVRRIVAEDIRLHGKQAVAHKIQAFDLKSGRKTVAVFEDVQIDTGLEDGFFTKRHLKREGPSR